MSGGEMAEWLGALRELLPPATCDGRGAASVARGGEVSELLLRVIVPIKTVSEANQRGHWAKKAGRVKAQRNAVELVLRTSPSSWARAVAVLGPVSVVLTRIAPRRLDDDNLASALKATRDQVAAWLGVDDGDERVSWKCEQRTGRPKEYAVEVSIWG